MAREYFKVIPAVYVIFRKKDQVLLLRRLNTGYNDGNYSLPAGHHDGGETLTQAAIREAREETGVEIAPEDLRFVHVQHRQGDTGERVDFFYECKSWQGEITNGEPEKCDDLSWFPLMQLPVNMATNVRVALEEYAKHSYYSEPEWPTM